ncbi:TIGR03086 family metal-binding protein [Streptomyces sp. NPDC051000]|uniref:TIGR03086 family metal-binding protein n=1 Tax=Streptomyces sp. NPDC051000 TaxID=3155520 RepID=UPI0033F0B5B7
MNRTAARYQRVLSGVSDVVSRIPGDLWNAPSPCTQWTALHVLGHLVDGQHQIAALITGQGPREPLKDPVAAVGGDPTSTWAATTLHMDSLLAVVDPAAVIPSHHGDVTVEAVLGTAVIEPLIHAWDLAQAADLAVSLDEEAVATCLAVIAPMAEQFAATGMYAPARAARMNAAPQQRLLALLGRGTG